MSIGCCFCRMVIQPNDDVWWYHAKTSRRRSIDSLEQSKCMISQGTCLNGFHVPWKSVVQILINNIFVNRALVRMLIHFVPVICPSLFYRFGQLEISNAPFYMKWFMLGLWSIICTDLMAIRLVMVWFFMQKHLKLMLRHYLIHIGLLMATTSRSFIRW